MWRWARISIEGRKFLGLYGRDEYGFVFHAVVDLDAVGEADVAAAAAVRDFEALAIWRLGTHETFAIDTRLPPQLQAAHRAAYEQATPGQTVVLLLGAAEVTAFALPDMH
jgi:hypothetical protein